MYGFENFLLTGAIGVWIETQINHVPANLFVHAEVIGCLAFFSVFCALAFMKF